MNSSVHLHHFSISPNPCAPKSSFSCSMPRPPNRNRRTSRSRNPSRPTTIIITTTTKPCFHPSSSPSHTDPLQATFDRHYLYHTSHYSLQQFLSSASDALQKLRALVSVDADNRVLVSCRPSTLRFVGNLVILTFAVVLGFRVLVGLVRLGFGGPSRYGREGTVLKRDRSLGGKEVVVGRVEKAGVDVKKKKTFGMLDNPLSVPKRTVVDSLGRLLNSGVRVWEKKKKLPSWWPSSMPQPSLVVDKDYYQSEADRLVRVITDNRMSGNDIVEDDIIHLRQICRTSRVRVTFDTTNTRDSFYRVSVDFVLNTCSRARSHSTYVQIDSEDVCQFVAGLAENIGLDNIRAARIVSASIAARTFGRFLQAWALIIQGKHTEAGMELSKICLILRIFPSEESSPEMEMVARGLAKHLKLNQRQFLMCMLVGICSEEGQGRAAEALGLNLDLSGLDGKILDA